MELHREDELLVKATVVGNILLGAETLDLGTLLTSVTRSVQISLRLIKCVVTVNIHFDLSIVITFKQRTTFLVEIWFNISIIEDLTEHMDIGSHWRHLGDLPNVGRDVRRVVDRLMRTVMRSTWESWRRRRTGCS